jgi:hypothetical protein
LCQDGAANIHINGAIRSSRTDTRSVVVLAPDSRDERQDLACHRGIDAEDPSDQSGTVEGVVVTHVRSVKSEADQRRQERCDHDNRGEPEKRARWGSAPTRSWARR